MRRRDVLRGALGAAALPLVSSAVTADSQDSYEPLGHVAIEATKEVVVDGETAYAATTDGFATVDVSDPATPEVLSEASFLLSERENGPLRQIYDVKVDGDTLIVVGPANGSSQEILQGMAVYDVSDPASPERTGFHETDFPIHNAYLDGDVAYLTANDQRNNPVVMVDVSATPEEVGRWSIVDHDDRWRTVNWFVRSNHDLYVQDGTLYIAHWDAGTWLVDVSDPANPEYVNHFGHYDVTDLQNLEQPYVEGVEVPGNSHYVTVNDDATLLGSGAEAWDVAETENQGGPGGIDLWDISDPQNPEKVAFVEPPETPDATQQGTWTTSHNFELRGDRLYTSWYRGGVKLFDVSDPTNPEELAWWRQPEQASFWTAQYLSGDAFVTSNRAGSGDYPSGVYTFPNRAGEQANPPSMAPQTPTTTAGGSTTSGSDSTATTAAQSTTTSAVGDTTTEVPEGSDSGVGVPGFGVVAGLSAASAAALAAWRRID